jgi:nicotinate-nucleotide pyrophosphorylase (carboxylating)
MDIQTYIDDLLTLAIAEDIGDGDHTSLAVISPQAEGKMKLLVKENGVIAGIEIAKQIFRRIDRLLEMEQLLKDGAQVKKGDIAFYVTGKERALLQAERLVLNIMQRMSGVATQTAAYVKELKGLKTQVLDTRKTTPGMRVLDKLAVKTGSGGNHRMGLFDMILLKDNHIDFAGGIEQAIMKTREYLQNTKRKLAIEIEVRSLDDLKTVLRTGGVQRIMFDNFDLSTTKEAVALVAGRYETESSGGITRENLRAYAECGVDFISVGALTHQIKSLDLSLKAV